MEEALSTTGASRRMETLTSSKGSNKCHVARNQVKKHQQHSSAPVCSPSDDADDSRSDLDEVLSF